MKFKLSLLTIAGILLVSCGGGCSSCSSEIPPSTTNYVVSDAISNWSITPDKLINFANYSNQVATGYTGNEFVATEVLGSGDINGDGFDDIVIGNYINFGQPIKPTVLFFNPATFKFELNENLQKVLPLMIWPRKIAIEDVDGDGRNDLFISDHGEENQAHLGAQNRLILNTVNGYVDGTYLLPQVKDFSHTIAVADFDKNGKNDLLVINSPFIKNLNDTNTNDSYVLFNTGSLNLIKGVLNLDNKRDINFNNTIYPSIAYHAAFLSDLNNDTIPDIVLGGDDALLIVESKPDSSYKSSIKFQPPAVFKNKFSNHYFPYSYIITHDIDGDGQKEIIASVAHQEPVTWNWLGSYFQVIKSVNGKWQDVTEKFFPEQGQSQDKKSWCYKIYVIDVNNDGNKDLICSSSEHANKIDNIFWFFDGNKFIRKDQASYANISLRQIFPIKLKNETYLIGKEGMFKYHGWKIN